MLTLLTGDISQFYRERLQRDFPPEELPPLSVLQEGAQAGIYETWLYAPAPGAVPAAYGMVLQNGRDALLFFFAVEPERRGRGVGSACMEELFSRFGASRAMIIEVERPEGAKTEAEAALRRRRIRFYERLGYKAEPGIDYVLMGVPFLLMTRTLAGPSYTPEELRRAILEIYARRPGVAVSAELNGTGKQYKE